jgi:hypothetical protein
MYGTKASGAELARPHLGMCDNNDYLAVHSEKAIFKKTKGSDSIIY